MSRYVAGLVILMLATGARLAGAQAAVGYGVAASKAAGMAAGAARTLEKKVNQGMERVKTRLAEPSLKSAPPVRQKPAAPSATGSGSLKVESVPDKSSVLVDGALVGSTPVELKLPAGSHMVQVRRPGYEIWARDVVVEANATISVKAELPARYRSSVTISME